MLNNHIFKSISSAAIKNVRSKSSGTTGSMMKKGFGSFTRPGAFRASLAMHKPEAVDNFVNGTSAVYVDYVFEQWQ